MTTDAEQQLLSLPFALVVVGPDLRIATLNPAAEQLFGQSVRKLVDARVQDVLRFVDPSIITRMQDSEAQIFAPAALVALPGQPPRALDVTIDPVVDAPNWRLLTLHDPGGVEALAGEEGMPRAPDVLAHEIKNPLAGIRGAAQLLARKADPADRALTTLIADEVDRIAKLIDQMQTLSRRGTGPVAPCNLHEVIRRALAVLAAGRPVPVIVEEFDPSLPNVLGNADALVQIALNLLVNAAEACSTATNPTLFVRTRFASGLQLQPTGGGAAVRLPIELRISDNGPGIDPDLCDHVFEPFVSGKKTGQGLGLALVRRLVRDMNGRVGHDRDDKGGWTHFHIHLPVASAQPKQICEVAA